MSDALVTLTIDGRRVLATPETTVAAAILLAGGVSFRRSVTGEPRGPLCGMGICFECRVTLDGAPNQRSCQTLCTDGMEVRTDAG
jgi:predicted molibdopterin-dependent oxidoreductase YjgC